MFKNFLGSLVRSFLVSLMLLFIFALVVYLGNISDRSIGVIIMVIYLVSTIIGGIYIGGQIEGFKEIWGMVSGFVYIGIIMLVSVIGSKSRIPLDISSVSAVVVSVLGGMIGAMVSKR